jgi:hypothetical protein
MSGERIVMGNLDFEDMSPLDAFLHMMPPEQLTLVLELSNERLAAKGKKELTHQELLWWIGVCILISSINFLGDRRKLWEGGGTYSKFLPSYNLCATGMSRNCLDDIWYAVRWSHQPPEQPAGMSSEWCRWMCSRLISLIGLIGLMGVGDLCITSLVGSSALSARQLIGLIGFLIAAKTISRRLNQAAALGVATLQSSATKIVDVAFYYFASSLLHVYLLVREKMLWWLALAKKKMWRWIASFGESYHDDTLQLAKHLFSVRLPLMTKFCVMRECDNILSGYLSAVTTVFSQQDGIYGFKFLTRFFGDLLQRSHSFVSFDSFLNLII